MDRSHWNLCGSPWSYTVCGGGPGDFDWSLEAEAVPRKIFFLTLCLMAAYAAWIEGRPWIVCPDNLEKPVTQEQREKLRDYWGGFYSQRIPILAHYIVVRENGEDGLEATVFYLWFGSIGVSFDSEGLPSITKPLSGL